MPEKYGPLWRNAAARECLVDIADRDYICARIAWRASLLEQFLWSGLQAVEKYLKAILLFNGRSARGLGHDIETALHRVELITDIPFDFPADVRAFIKHLNAHAPNRYLERPFYVLSGAIVSLDKTVWYLRRYCQPLRDRPPHIPVSDQEWLTQSLRAIQAKRYKERPIKFKLFSGYLEDVLKGREGPEPRRALVWQNVFFGARWKPEITLPGRARSAIPPHYRHPELFSELAKILDFPRAVKKEFKNGGV